MRHNINSFEIAKHMGWEHIGSPIIIQSLNLCNRKTCFESVLSYITTEKYLRIAMDKNAVQAIILTPELYEQARAKLPNVSVFLLSSEPEYDFYRLHNFLYEETDFYEKYDFDTIISKSCIIHSSAVVSPGVKLGERVTIGAGSVILPGVEIGNDSTVGCNTVIGGDGFQLIYNKDKVPFMVRHAGMTRIGQNVWIGHSNTICNSLFEGATTIGNNCKLDNQIHVAHNCEIGDCSVIISGVTLLGSSVIQERVWIGPQSVLMNRATVQNDAFVGAMSFVCGTVKCGTKVFGIPALKIDF